MLASVIGLRAKATAIAVPSSSRSVCSAASSSGKNGSWLVSAVQTPVVAGGLRLLGAGRGVRQIGADASVDLHGRRP